MSEALEKAEAAVTAAETNTVAVQLALAAVELAKAASSQQQPHQCQHQAPRQDDFNVKKWLTIGGLGIVGGLVASLFAVAIAIGAVSVAILALVLRSMWRDIQKGR